MKGCCSSRAAEVLITKTEPKSMTLNLLSRKASRSKCDGGVDMTRDPLVRVRSSGSLDLVFTTPHSFEVLR
jgi:hypothetical protein